MEEDAPADEHRTTWGQAGVEAGPPAGAGAGPPQPSRKRPLEAEEEDELDDDVKRRLSALKGGAGLD